MGDFLLPAPEPPTELGRYRVLSSTAGIRVSPLCLGGMSIGDAWTSIMGSLTKENAFKLLDAFAEAGGNFIDTANNYQDEQSEKWIGEWMAARKNRDLMVIATKYSTMYRSHELGKGKTVNYSGNHKRSLHMSVRDSLKKLQTDFIDLLYVHWWDWTTSIEEVMDSLDILVKQGKVLYLGVSDTPAWVVATANTYALAHGKTPFSVYQGRWNVMRRDFERDILPMARHFGMALAPWDVIGGGKFQSKKQIEARQRQGEQIRPSFYQQDGQSPDEEKISAVLEKVAAEHGVDTLSTIALAYVLHKAPNVFPIIGGRKVEHLHDNIKALSIKLTDQQIAFLDAVQPFDPGFPANMIGESPRSTGKSQPLLTLTAHMAWSKPERPWQKDD
ncbi:aryl-alcohol dehydrogenase AAD14 [Capronia epimyces CBS 606.96]|uniref:Aldo-keto reductase ausK n=1 Tax=Capronia epimyces CBS 606.96 TaxID=1182542 RepID=W9XEP2_9EURO|nr:aryl-alcohol dehydrogenase AAD14 [Capronia epimyces CBS 606.96]EXJ78962.1 aryl-alcohol dehydrogenase AAD14 [Capronia epimyces CBS 606.96]